MGSNRGTSIHRDDCVTFRGEKNTNKASKHLIFKELHEMKGSADCEKSTVVTQVFKRIS